MAHHSRRALLGAAATCAVVPLLGSRRATAATAAGAADAASNMGNAFSVMAADDRLTTWVRIVEAAGLGQYARAAKPYTVFPISDAAFDGSPGMAHDLLAFEGAPVTHQGAKTFPDIAEVAKVVRTHVVPGKHEPGEFQGKKVTLTSFSGTPIEIDGTGHPMRVTWTSAIDGKKRASTVEGTPVVCTNAVIYVLDQISQA